MNEKQEEKCPLLFVYVQDNDKKSEFPHKLEFTDTGRGKDVSEGAATIITQWPGQLAGCWTTTVMFGLIIIFMSLLILLSTLKPMYHVHPRCLRDAANFYADKRIHLVKNGREWNQEQLDILKLIADTYPDYVIHNIILETSMHKYLEKHEIVKVIKPEINTQKPEDNEKSESDSWSMHFVWKCTTCIHYTFDIKDF
ncbi:hypothetical protein CBL_09429 [Carabus blaptoides fortunei]